MVTLKGMRLAHVWAGLSIAMSAIGFWPTEGSAVEPSMQTGGLTSQPIGHYEFCRQHQAECNIRSGAIAPERMSEELWRKITSVNSAVNGRIKPMSDIDLYGQDELWTYPAGVGDCEDYVLEKRRVLNASGVALSNLLITVVRKPDGEGHAVLTVRTDKGDYILDNLNQDVVPWIETGYRFLKRQAVENTGRWVSIRGGDTTLVGSVR